MEGSEWRVQVRGFRVEGSGWRIQGGGFRVEDSGWRVKSGGFRVEGFKFQDFGEWGCKRRVTRGAMRRFCEPNNSLHINNPQVDNSEDPNPWDSTEGDP